MSESEALPSLGRSNMVTPFDAEVFVRECMSKGAVIEEDVASGRMSRVDGEIEYRMAIKEFAGKLRPHLGEATLAAENARLKREVAEFRAAHRARMTR